MYQTIAQRPEGDWPEDGLETLGACPVCESAQRSVLHEGLRDNVFFCAPGKWTMWRCGGCRSAYLDPRPTPETIHLAYARYYTHTPPVPAQPTTELPVHRKVRRALANGYRNWRYGTKHRPASRLGIAAALALPSSRRRIDRPFQCLPHLESTVGRRVLDVGFGSGEFLDFATSAGWNAFGCDLDLIAVENASRRGLNVRHGGAEAWQDEEASFDAVTVSHVIEHVHDPVDTLKTLFRLLRPGGQLYVDTPNIDALGHQHYGRYWLGLDPPRHLVLFQWRNIKHILTKLGYVAIRRRTYPMMTKFGLASAKVAAGHSPFGYCPARVAGPHLSVRVRAHFAHNRSEFITLTCHRPA